MIHHRTLGALDFNSLLACLAGYCQSERGAACAVALKPLPDEQAVAGAQKLYDEYLTFASRPGAGQNAVPGAFRDMTGLVDELSARGTARVACDLDDLFDLRDALQKAAACSTAICVDEAGEKWPGLLALASDPPMPQTLIQALARCINDDGELRDEASPELFQVRTELRSLHQTALRRARSFAEKYNVLPYLQDEFMTLSSDRYVLPFKASYKNKMQGIVHDYSQTGETCYFEPMFLVELNNRIQELRREEREEERKVILFLAELVARDSQGVLAALRLLTELDLLRAKSCLASAIGGRMVPLTSLSEGILLTRARHPLLMLAGTGKTAGAASQGDGEPSRDSTARALKAAYDRVRPVDIIFRPGDRAVVITGGNAGGKTVCLKTLGLCVAMTLAGLPAPVDAGSHLPWISRMDAFIGDEQSLEDNVSTFTAQIKHLARAWKHLGPSGLVLLDEFGAGTDPAQGAALAQAVLDELLARQVFVLTATHFPALKSYALARDGVRAASMLFDADTRKPLYVLAYDQVGASQALDVAREYGLPECVLRRAEHYLLQDGEDTSALLRKLNELALQREKEMQVLKEEQVRARNAQTHYRERLESERHRLHEEVRAKAQELMRAVKEQKATHKQALRQMSALRAELARADKKTQERSAASVPSLQVGDMVTHTIFRRKGVVTEVDERRGRVRLDMGGVSLWADTGVLGSLPAAKAVSAKNSAPRPQAVQKARGQSASQAAAAAWSADVRGMRADEAVMRLQSFIDKAWLAEMDEVEIIHGRGTGALRRAIHEWLSGCAHVTGYSLAPADRGGDGMTIVSLG